MKTLFEKIIDREIPAKIEFENEKIIVIHDIAPKAPIHLLVIPKKPIPTVMDMTEEDTLLFGEMIWTAKKMAEKNNLQGSKLVFHVGEKGGQEVFHVHLHVLGFL